MTKKEADMSVNNDILIQQCLQKDTLHVLDTDMGIDDIMAIILTKLMGSSQPDYVIVTTGNTDIENGIKNLLAIRKLFGLSFKVVKGHDEKQPDSGTEAFHGADGFANTGSEFISRMNMTPDELDDYMGIDEFRPLLTGCRDIEYTAIGPLGNLAYFLRDDAINDRIKKIYVMGGGIKEFNCPYRSEFNFYKNPEAVRTVLSCRKDTVLFPLDITNRQRLSMSQIEELACSTVFPEAGRLLAFNLGSNMKFGGIPAAVLHDTLPILYQCTPELFKTEDMLIDTDEFGSIFVSDNGHNITVALSVAPELVTDRLKSLLL